MEIQVEAGNSSRFIRSLDLGLLADWWWKEKNIAFSALLGSLYCWERPTGACSEVE